MSKNKRMFVLLGILGALVIMLSFGYGAGFVSGEKQDENTKNNNENVKDAENVEDIDNILTDPDLTITVEETLEKMPELSSEIEKIQGMKQSEIKDNFINTSLKKSFNTEKEYFRAKLMNKLTDQQSKGDIQKLAESNVENYLNALEIADKNYNITVSQKEVNEFIDENVTNNNTEEKERYAESLGITTDQLDYAYDRDFYIMDTLWDKLIPALMEEYPQKEDEIDNAYYDRIKMEFYDRKVSKEY